MSYTCENLIMDFCTISQVESLTSSGDQLHFSK